MKTLCFTGHRPQKMGGFGNSPKVQSIKKALREEIILSLKEGYERFISGGALGVDQWAIEILIDLKKEYPNLKIVIARPFPSQDKIWPEDSRKHFIKLCQQSDEVVDVNPDPFTSWKMQARNDYMINLSSRVIAVFDGTPGGTANAVKSAQKKNKEIRIINPNNL